MPSLIRFLVFSGILIAAVYGGLFAMQLFFEPQQKEISVSVPGVKLRR